MTKITRFIEILKERWDNDTFVKLNLGNYKGNELDLKKIFIKKVKIKQQEKVNFVYRYKTKDITKNYSFDESLNIIKEQLNETSFRHAYLSSLDADFTLQYSPKGHFLLKKLTATTQKLPSKHHDRDKNRKIQAQNKPYLTALRITNEAGEVYKKTQDKFKQINHYIEILSPLIERLPKRNMIRVADMGAGKGYLTFALYDYLNNTLKRPSQIIGVEYRKDLVDICNDIALKSNFKQLHFEQGTIEDFEPKAELNVLIALHACDTATDDAIHKGIINGSDLIVVAPCCHKQIRKEMEKNKTSKDLNFLLEHGIFLERQAEMVTDGIRALILEYHGYSTKVFEFISDAHTPKNVLIVGEKKNIKPKNQADILAKIQAAKTTFGIKKHYLEYLNLRNLTQNNNLNNIQI